MKIKIDTKCLTVGMYTVTKYNGSGLFYLENEDEYDSLSESDKEDFEIAEFEIV